MWSYNASLKTGKITLLKDIQNVSTFGKQSPVSFTAAFEVSILSPSTFRLTDISTGSDPNLTGRKIYLMTAYGTFLVPTGTLTDYIVWPISDNSITLTDILTTDMALNIRVDWASDAPIPGSTYTVTQAYCFPDFNKQFLYGLTQQMETAAPKVVNTSFMANFGAAWSFLDAAQNAIDRAADIYNSQNALNQASNMRLNQNLYF